MFGGKFSLTRYSLGKQELEFDIRAKFIENFMASLGVRKTFQIEATNYENSQSFLILTPGIFYKTHFDIALLSQCDLASVIPIKFDGVESILSILWLAKNIHYKSLLDEKLSALADLSKNINIRTNLETVIKEYLMLAKNIHVRFNLVTILEVTMSLFTLENETLYIDVTIPPGSKLYIDSENFNVFLDGKNILYLHNGDWIHLDRSTLRLLVDNGTGGNLTGTLTARERYL